MILIFIADGYMEIDVDKDQRAATFNGKNTKLKIDNAPLRSCYQRPSDSPLYDTTQGYTISSSRRRRSSVHDEIVDVASKVEYKKVLERSKRQTVTYNYDAFCDRVFESTSSSLAQ